MHTIYIYIYIYLFINDNINSNNTLIIINNTNNDKQTDTLEEFQDRLRAIALRTEGLEKGEIAAAIGNDKKHE